GVFRSSTMTSGLLLNTTTNIIESITGELDDMEGVHDFDRIGQFLDRGCFEAVESAHRDDVDAITPVLRTGFQPLLAHLLRPARLTSGLLLNTSTNFIESITGELDDMEGVHDFDRIGQFLDRGCFEAGESVHRDDVDAITPVLRTGFQPLLEHLLRPSGHHVE